MVYFKRLRYQFLENFKLQWKIPAQYVIEVRSGIFEAE